MVQLILFVTTPAFTTYEAYMRKTLRIFMTALLIGSLGSCALFQPRDAVTINVVGIEPLPAQELEIRFAVKLRLQNPNETAIDYNGVALNLEVNGQPLATGVSDRQGRIERYSEDVLVVPVSVSAFSALRQALGLTQTQSLDGLPYVLRGKLAGGVFGTVRFEDRGRLNLPAGGLQ
jgi:LEA14-like dessication related protein